MSEGIKAFGARFAGRVDAEKLRFAIEYVDYGESGLAFETICDYIVEEDGPSAKRSTASPLKFLTTTAVNGGLSVLNI